MVKEEQSNWLCVHASLLHDGRSLFRWVGAARQRRRAFQRARARGGPVGASFFVSLLSAATSLFLFLLLLGRRPGRVDRSDGRPRDQARAAEHVGDAVRRLRAHAEPVPFVCLFFCRWVRVEVGGWRSEEVRSYRAR